MEILNEFWTWFLGLAGGISVVSILTAVIYGLLKGAFNRTISKINVEKISDKATEKGIERVKKIAFTQSIQPIVESELEKITEKIDKKVERELKIVQKNQENLVAILKYLSSYFDDSIAVGEEKKAELKDIIAKAEKRQIIEQEISVEEVVEEKPRQSTELKNKILEQKEEPKKKLKVER